MVGRSWGTTPVKALSVIFTSYRHTLRLCLWLVLSGVCAIDLYNDLNLPHLYVSVNECARIFADETTKKERFRWHQSGSPRGGSRWSRCPPRVAGKHRPLLAP